MRARDLTGMEFGRLIAVEPVRHRDPSGRSRLYWLCKCICGTTKQIECSNLIQGLVTSCGCLQRERIGSLNLSHGFKKNRAQPPEYAAWQKAKERCCNPNSPKYPIYGGRGIKMADVWLHDFAAFYKHVGPRPSYRHSLDRIDVNGDYAPGNVRWATRRQQAENTRVNVIVNTLSGPVTLKELARRFRVNYQSLHARVHKHKEDPFVAAKRLARKKHRS